MRISLAEAAPVLCKEWSERNRPLTPRDVTSGSNRKVWWRGACGHEWAATVKNRSHGHGCPVCSGNRVLSGYNDLATLCPGLQAEWSERNLSLMPGQVAKRSNRMVWWRCITCGHEWEARVADRAEGHGCPLCMKCGRLFPGENDLGTLYPSIAREWSDRNRPLLPNMVKPLSVKNVWWKCSLCGHEWKAIVRTRVNGGGGCPNCAHQQILIRKEKLSPVNALRFYAEKANVDMVTDDEESIGVPLDVVFPDYFAAVLVSDWKHNKHLGYKRQNAINELCRKNGILLIRIINRKGLEFDNCICITRLDDSDEALGMALLSVFQMLCIDADVDICRDRSSILRYDDLSIENEDKTEQTTSIMIEH